MTDMVQVPRELLRAVLEDATDNLNVAANGAGEAMSRVLKKDRARIAELRKAAGLDNPPDNG